jgi:hypothetical protein
VMVLISIIVATSGLAELFAVDTLADWQQGVAIGCVAVGLTPVIQLAVLWYAHKRVVKAVDNNEAIRVDSRIIELWRTELQRIKQTHREAEAWHWLTTERYEALTIMANGYQQATPERRNDVEREITQQMRTLGHGFRSHFRHLRRVEPDTDDND